MAASDEAGSIIREEHTACLNFTIRIDVQSVI